MNNLVSIIITVVWTPIMYALLIGAYVGILFISYKTMAWGDIVSFISFFVMITLWKLFLGAAYKIGISYFVILAVRQRFDNIMIVKNILPIYEITVGVLALIACYNVSGFWSIVAIVAFAAFIEYELIDFYDTVRKICISII